MRENKCRYLVHLPQGAQDMAPGYYCAKDPKMWDLILPTQCDTCVKKECPFCGDFVECNNAEGCDTCRHFAEWFYKEEKEVTR